MKLLLPCVTRFQKRGTRRLISLERTRANVTLRKKSHRARNFCFAGNALSSFSLALSVFIVKFKQGFAFVTYQLKAVLFVHSLEKITRFFFFFCSLHMMNSLEGCHVHICRSVLSLFVEWHP